MKLVESSIRYPVSVAVAVLLVSLFGILAVVRIPIQLIPEVEFPQAVVTTAWPGASPEEIETEIVREQEEQLKSLEGLTEMTSQSVQSLATVKLRFDDSVDPETVLMQVSNRLQQVPEYPTNVLKPVILKKDPFEQQVLAWTVLTAIDPAAVDIELERQFALDVVRPALERIPGVAASAVYGGRDRELQVTVDPQQLAVRGLTLGQVAAALDAENRDISAGDFDEGKRSYVVRTVSEYSSPEHVEEVVLAWRGGAPVYVRDVARVQLGYGDRESTMRQKGQPSLGLTVVRATGSNSLLVSRELKETVRDLNAGVLAERGLVLEIAFVESDYIENAISLVQRNIVVGGLFAIAVLMLFLRSFAATLVIGLAIPVSVVGTLLAMNLVGRNINVVSLAGMAFAVGLIVDASIVVLENIFRHVQMGKRRSQAAYDGTVEVWGAVLASVLTTVAVFLPILFVQEEAGQLFRDIAVAVSAAVLISLVVSVTVIPSLAARVLGSARDMRRASRAEQTGWRRLGGLVDLGHRVNDAIADSIYWLSGSAALRLVLIVGLGLGAVATAWAIMPETEYLPTGNVNFAFGMLLPPPGYNEQELIELSQEVERQLAPYWETAPGSPDEAELDAPPIAENFFASFQGGVMLGVIGYQEYAERTPELLPVLQRAVGSLPGTYGIVQQPSLFQTSADPGRAINIDLTGPDLEPLLERAGRVFGTVMAILPTAQVQPIPGLDLGNPEIRVIPDRERAAELGLTASDLGFALNALVDGVKVSEYEHEGRMIDLILRGELPYASRSQDIEQLNFTTPTGRVVRVGDVADVLQRNGPTQINHIERMRAVTIQVVPDPRTPLERAMSLIETQVLEPMRADGSLAPPYSAVLAGTADKLTTTRRALQANFLLALAVTYLLMAALFESFLYPLVILFSVPFAAVGGFMGLAAVNQFVAYQALDVIAMLGFVILIGIVVNNAILIVHQTLNYIRDQGMEHRDALREAVSDRIRPIFMSTLTSVMGMAPLVLVTGAGSEMYRGLGSVVVGGLLVSTLFTLFLVPTVLSVVLDLQSWLLRLRAGEGEDEAPAGAG